MRAAEASGSKLKCFRREPILEVVCELRFVPTTPGAGNLLPGLLQASFGQRFPRYEVLPASNFPLAMRQMDENLKYAPTSRLSGEEGHINVGENVISLSISGAASGVRDYPGWEVVLELAETAFQAVLKTGFVQGCERVSLKYINLLGAGSHSSVSELTNVTLKLDDELVATRPLQLRTEMAGDGHVAIVQIANPADVKLIDGTRRKGLVLEVDAVRIEPMPEADTRLREYLNAAHTEAARVFFKLLSPAAIAMHEPVYE